MNAKRARIALDSSYLIALLSDWHGQHQRTFRSYVRWVDQDAQILLPVHSVLECYSVLTRIPAPYRLSAELAQQTIKETFSESATIVGLRPQSVWPLVDTLARRGIVGGQVYDALITASAAEAHASVLMTWNPKHFIAIAPAYLEVREP
jgi:predicted nucleic acid-binding protein